MRHAIVIGVFWLCASAARAQEVGTVVAVEGTVEIGRGGGRVTAVPGGAVNRGDELRTGRPGRLRVLFRDDSEISLDEETQLVVDEQVFDEEAFKAKSVFGVLKGTVGAVVSEYYNGAGNSFEVRTKTAVAGVRGTEFRVTYDPESEVTDVAGVSGLVMVHSAADPSAPGVLIGAYEVTRVSPGSRPSPPQRLDDRRFNQLFQGVEFVGRGRPEGLSQGHSLTAGGDVPKPDRAPPPAGGIPGQRSQVDATTILGQPPGPALGKGRLGIEFGH